MNRNVSARIAGLTVAGLACISSAGSIDAIWSGPSTGEWNVPAYWNPAVIPNNSGEQVFHVHIGPVNSSNVSVNLNLSPSIDALTVEAGNTLQFSNGFDLFIEGGVVQNDGTIFLNSNGGFTDLVLSGDAVIQGAGVLKLSANPANRFYSTNASFRLTNESTHTIRGSGLVGNNLMLMTNVGTIEAPNAIPLVMDLAGTDNQNSGAIRASGAGILQITGTTIDNSLGVIEAIENGVVDFTGVSSVTGGLLETTDDGLIRISSNTTLANLEVQGHIDIASSFDPILSGTIVNHGAISMLSTGSNTDLRISGDVTLDGQGEVWLSPNNGNRIFGIQSNQRLTNGAEHTLRGSGQIGANFMALTNLGSIVADASPAMTIDPSSTGALNKGLIHVTGTGGLSIAAGPFTTEGVIVIDAGRQLTRTGNIDQTGGSTTVQGTLKINSGTFNLFAGQLLGTGSLQAPFASTGGQLLPGVNSIGTLSITGSATFNSSSSLTIDVASGRASDRVAASGVLTLGGTLVVAHQNDYAPVVGDSFTIATASSVNGTFESIEHPDMCGMTYEVTTNRGVVTLVVTETDESCGGVLGDLNGDDIVNGADLGLLLAAWGTAGPGDLNNDGTVNGADLGILLSSWS